METDRSRRECLNDISGDEGPIPRSDPTELTTVPGEDIH